MKKKSGKRAEEHPKASNRSEHSGIQSDGNDGAGVKLSGKLQDFERIIATTLMDFSSSMAL